MELYTEEELRELLDEAYNLGQQDLVDYIDEASEEEDYEAYDEDYEDEESAFDQVMQEGLLSNIKEKILRRNKTIPQDSSYGRKIISNTNKTVPQDPFGNAQDKYHTAQMKYANSVRRKFNRLAKDAFGVQQHKRSKAREELAEKVLAKRNKNSDEKEKYLSSLIQARFDNRQ